MQIVTNEAPRTRGEEHVERRGRGELLRAGEFRVLRLRGSDYEMGYQHGALLADEVRTGPIPYFRSVVEKLVGKGSLGPLSKLVWPTLQRTVGRRVARAIPDAARQHIVGVADGAKLDRQVFIDGCTMPDALMWVAARAMSLRGHGPAVAHRLAFQLEQGCTSAVAWGDATRDGRLLHARNFDYHGVGNWPAHKALIFHEPDVGQRYVSVASAGVPLAGITAMNEAGLTLTVHQHMFTDRTRLGGTPIGLVGDQVMRHAKNLDEAQRILDAHTPIGSWTYIVTDGKTREVLCHEENPDRRAAQRHGGDEGGTFGYANVYLDRELGASEINLYGSYWRHNEGRHRRVNELLGAQRGALDPASMAGILGDTGATSCRVRDSIAMVMTVGSVVFRPDDGTVWVGTGEAPTSRGTFEPFSLERLGPHPERGTLSVGEDEAPEARDAFEAFRRAFIAYTDDQDLGAALDHANRAAALAPEQSLYHALGGLFSINRADGPAAERALDRAIALGHPDEERVASFHLHRARARDLAGDRTGACRDYRESLGRRSDPQVRAAALQGLRRPYSSRRARALHVDVGLIDVVDP